MTCLSLSQKLSWQLTLFPAISQTTTMTARTAPIMPSQFLFMFAPLFDLSVRRRTTLIAVATFLVTRFRVPVFLFSFVWPPLVKDDYLALGTPLHNADLAALPASRHQHRRSRKPQ